MGYHWRTGYCFQLCISHMTYGCIIAIEDAAIIIIKASVKLGDALAILINDTYVANPSLIRIFYAKMYN